MNVDIIKPYLDGLYNKYREEYLYTDPLKFAHKYHAPEDREISGFIASALAYGNVKQIDKSVDFILKTMGSSPRDFVDNYTPAAGSKYLEGFKHRFNTGKDICVLLYYFNNIFKKHKSLEGLFLTGYKKEDKTIGPALSDFCRYVLSINPLPFYPGGKLPPQAGVRYFFASPENGSACKRMNLFLRWMVRRADNLDLGLWKRVDPAKLVIPLDVHVTRMAQRLGLTNLKTASWKMALQITKNLRLLDPDDPVKYDFALCRPGILKKCGTKREPEACKNCEIYHVCYY